MNISKSLNSHIDGFAENFASSFYAYAPTLKRTTPAHLRDAEFLAYEQESENIFRRGKEAHETAKNAIRELVARDAKESWVAPEKFAPKKPLSIGRVLEFIVGVEPVKGRSVIYTPKGLSHVYYRVNPAFTLAIDEHDPFSPVLLITRGVTILTSPVFSVRIDKYTEKFAPQPSEDVKSPGDPVVGGVCNRGLGGDVYSSVCLQPIPETLTDLKVLIECRIYENEPPHQRFVFDMTPSNRYEAAAEETKVMNAFLEAQARKLVRALYAVSKVLGPVPGSKEPFPAFNHKLHWTVKAFNPDPTRFITHLVYRKDERRFTTGEPAIRVIED